MTTRPGVPIFRLVHHRDPVPHLPLEAWGYHHPPTEVFYTEDQSSYQVCNSSGEDDTCSNQFWVSVFWSTFFWCFFFLGDQYFRVRV